MIKTTKGHLITLEGLDYVGKTTQRARLVPYLESKGVVVKIFREPGGTDIGERIRDILLDTKTEISDATEFMLYSTARSDLAYKKIIPCLENGEFVVLDRFYDSSTAYQGYGRGLTIEDVKNINSFVTYGLVPNLTILFDMDVERAFERENKRKAEADRLEREKKEFFERIRSGFLEIAREEPQRFKVINADRSEEEVFQEVKMHIDEYLTNNLIKKT